MAAAAAPAAAAPATMPQQHSDIDAHRLSNSELDSWSSNMSDARTVYAPSLADTASIYTTATTSSTRSMRDRFKMTFRRKKRFDPFSNELTESSTGTSTLKTQRSNSTIKDHRPSLESIGHISHFRKNSDSPKAKRKSKEGAWNPETKTFTLNKDTGEVGDYTDMMHALVHHDTNDSTPEHIVDYGENRDPGEPMVASLPSKVWKHIAEYLSISDTACLSLSSKTLLDRVGIDSWQALKSPYYKFQRLNFLKRMDSALPNHLYCPICEIYHIRTQKGHENMKPTLVLNHLFKCPHLDQIPPRTRIASGRTLPFTFVQLALRADKWGPEYGVTLNSMARRWKEPETGWSHTTVYRIHNGHLLMRVVSQKAAVGGMVEAAKRGFFYNMYEDFTPYFSVCAHWRDGDLMKICKCAVDHLPPPKYRIRDAHKMEQTALPERPRIVAMCGNCQPMRRCPECPTEYLVELKLVEDLKDPIYRFKQAIVITRWSDLGDGSTPDNVEWASINGNAYYSSVIEIGRRAISGIFESKTSNDNMNIPGQRVVSLNPKGEHEGEEGDSWY
ncbi:hypothetical protein AAFC00_005167 [Neodothiora populina]|uniref:F-box domain-containing protein n=1 Tax=Neodothiora populina TaxID=2781224 RepID=A0ABR3PKD8_9PEZI